MYWGIVSGETRARDIFYSFPCLYLTMALGFSWAAGILTGGAGGPRAILRGLAMSALCLLVGGQALVTGHPLEKLYRQVRSLRLVEGASDLLRINLAKGKLELDKGRL